MFKNILSETYFSQNNIFIEYNKTKNITYNFIVSEKYVLTRKYKVISEEYYFIRTVI